MSIIDPKTGAAARTQTHTAKLEMLFEWLTDVGVLSAIVETHVASQRDLVRLTARLSATIGTPGAGTDDGEPGVSEADCGRFMFLLLDEPAVLRAVTALVNRLYRVPFQRARKELRGMLRELRDEQPAEEDDDTTPPDVPPSRPKLVTH